MQFLAEIAQILGVLTGGHSNGLTGEGAVPVFNNILFLLALEEQRSTVKKTHHHLIHEAQNYTHPQVKPIFCLIGDCMG
jgi:hypothetical protein